MILERERRRTIALRVMPDGEIHVRAPHRTPAETIGQLLLKRARWIQKRRDFYKQCIRLSAPSEYVPGATVHFLGEHLTLETKIGKRSIEISNGTLTISHSKSLTGVEREKILNRWYEQKAREVFGELLQQILFRFTESSTPTNLKIRKMKSLWGSCALNGNITLNTQLIKTPRECIEYVVLHEVCHLAVRGHGKKFYQLVARYMPDWKKREEQLKFYLCR